MRAVRIWQMRQVISRAIKKFQADDLITKKGNQIWINEKQYRGLKRTVDEKIGSV